MEQAAKVRCQRIGCDAMFTEDDNPEGSCRYHDLPIFHDGMKEWSCCKKRSHDFSLFLEIPGCKTGKHTTEKPVPTKPAPTPKQSIPTSSPASDASSKESCPRCRQGFFCSDHGSQIRETNSKPVSSAPTPSAERHTDIQGSGTPAPAKKMVDINQPQTCKNKGCGKTFKEKDNHETACSYHPGPAVFHDRMRGRETDEGKGVYFEHMRVNETTLKLWKCCDIHVKEFDEFMEIPPCAKGWHNADPAS